MVLALGLTAAVGLAQNKAAKPRAAASPEEAVKYYVQAIKAADVNAVAAQMAEPQRGYFLATLQLQEIQQSLNQALEDEFGKDGKTTKGSDFQQYMKSIKDLRVVGKKARGENKVDLTVWQMGAWGKEEWIDELSVTAVKQGGAWKLLFPVRPVRKPKKAIRKGPDGKEVSVFENRNDETQAPSVEEMKYFADTMPKYKAALDKVARAIKDGQYRTRTEALKAIGAATVAFYKANPRPKRGS
jgi:hypothetical protein